MSTERRRNAGGRRRANGPANDPRGDSGRREPRGYAEDERAAGRRRTRDSREDDTGAGFWGDDSSERRPRRSREDRDDRGGPPPRAHRSAASPETGGRRRAGRREGGFDDERPPERRSRATAPQEGRRHAAAHGAGGGGRRRPPDEWEDEEDERGPLRRFLSKTWKPAIVTCGVGFVACVAFAGVAYAMTPDASDMRAQAEVTEVSTTISYKDGSEATTFGETNRVIVERGQIPDSVISGVLAAEQRGFWEEPAISPTGLTRAVLSGGSAGGGSTITQQMARNYYDGLSQERSYVRKFKEIFIALKVGQALSKDEILTQYLNTIYFGRQAYGVQAAAQAYFGKNVEDLDYAEGAFIGAIIQQPGNFENYEEGSETEELLHDRWENYVVDGMVELHKEDPEWGLSQAEAAGLEFPELQPYEPGDSYEGYKGYIIQSVQRELRDRYELSDTQINSGLRITTSLDQSLMEAAEAAVRETRPEGMPEETNYGLAAVHPATGEIRAFYGGSNFVDDANNSLIERGQAGSAFKPYTLATGLENGIGLRSVFDGDSPQEFPGLNAPVENDSNVSYGPVNLIESTANSINTSFVALAVEVGPAKVRETAQRAGIPEKQFETAGLGPNITLGVHEVAAVDQAAGFSTFANNGVHMPQHMIVEVKDRDGNVLEPNDADLLDTGSRAFSADAAADATYAMTQVVEQGNSGEATLDGRPVAGKTGTSNSAKSAWFVGFTPQLSTAVGLHRDDGQPVEIPGLAGVYGSTLPASIWQAFMTKAMEGEPVEQFPEPVYMGEERRFIEPSPSASASPSATQTQEETSSPSPDPTVSSPDPSFSPSWPNGGLDCSIPQVRQTFPEECQGWEPSGEPSNTTSPSNGEDCPNGECTSDDNSPGNGGGGGNSGGGGGLLGGG
ncbi:transglycosylase domain-containing protein [Salinactinospora qingdaonensis]|uniref:Transglycosylase domain-containing protein n=1 Tax=Salinactinospora qingdaonensis TaxID=702744 RepID=A0ABP7F799_9ACTN